MNKEWRIGLVGCVKGKRSEAAQAKDIYTSDLFKGRRRWVETTCGRWFVLSAEHGLLRPDEWTEPYEMSLDDATAEEVATWHRRTLNQIEEWLGELSRYHFEFHAGRNYWAHGLRAGLELAGATTSYPMAGKDIRQQLAAYRVGPKRDDRVTTGQVAADPNRAREAGRRLWDAWTTTGIFGQRIMPESTLPAGATPASKEHACFVTLTVAIDYMRDAAALWAASRAAFEDEATRWLFDPDALARATDAQIEVALGRHGVAKPPRDDTAIWGQVGRSLARRFGGDPRAIAERCAYRAPAVLAEIRRKDRRGHFPYLGGRKIGPLWIRMLADEVGLPLRDLEAVPIPVDVHIARVTWACGALAGSYTGTVDQLADSVAQVWSEACEGERFHPIQLDQALWLQGRDGCARRSATGDCPREAECVLSDLCVVGEIALRDGRMVAETVAPPSDHERTGPVPEYPATTVWDRVVAHAGEEGFFTVTGKPVRYTASIDEIVIEGRRGARIPRSDIELAASHGPLRSVADVPAQCWGRSYIFAVLTDPRVDGQRAGEGNSD